MGYQNLFTHPHPEPVVSSFKGAWFPIKSREEAEKKQQQPAVKKTMTEGAFTRKFQYVSVSLVTSNRIRWEEETFEAQITGIRNQTRFQSSE